MTIHLSGVQFAHPEAPEKPVLDIANWSVAAGEQVFVHGPSGSGKSTLLNLLSGLLECRQGEVSVLGERLDSMSSRQRDRFRANHIGYVFQRFNLIPYLSPLENIDLARSFSASKTTATATAGDLLAALNVARAEWDRPTSLLSMGQQQRVAIARALVNHPEFLIADEPTSSLDADNRDNFMEILMPLAAEQNMTLLFVSHDMGLAKHFARVEALTEISQAG
ncbi:ABC transporter ATP-binding protein [Halioglobus japonicus]|uniref:ABC transporter ATP-binding protein n=1 Tax=Halioglobus japonicus TaxID=930805 RepID=A0AAP8MEZ2_9GAMM|nr:ATP-binding cassette domain-containing protein [Halioglobus japonicus]AQA18596.1 ABC transporter ATP-binding protein [Halioglobus japonicus]PLW86620.1 ABC transporter ATP-binding protein [Halioglobus japonicus]GHD11926.1 methionine ABC transporter ATP-binding protein [Halioglobus japonicus]